MQSSFLFTFWESHHGNEFFTEHVWCFIFQSMQNQFPIHLLLFIQIQTLAMEE